GGGPGWSTAGARPSCGRAAAAGTRPPNCGAAARPPRRATPPSEWDKWADRLMSSRFPYLLHRTLRAIAVFESAVRPHVCGQTLERGGQHAGDVALRDAQPLGHLALCKILVEQVVDDLSLQVGQAFHGLQQHDAIFYRQLKRHVPLVGD